MKKLFLYIFAALLLAAPAQAQLLQQSDLEYLGAFRVPNTYAVCSSQTYCFAYSGSVIAFNPANQSLFIMGHSSAQKYAAEISIPVLQKDVAFAALNPATILQPMTDIFEGKLPLIDPDNFNSIGGMLVDNGKLVMTGRNTYDANGSQRLSHFSRPLNLSTTGQVFGPVEVNSGDIVSPYTYKAGFVSGYMGKIPPAWQGALGGATLTGSCCVAIVTRTSYGPAAFSFNSDLIGNPVPASSLLYYPSSHTTLGAYSSTGTYFNGTTRVTGVVFPEGSQSVLFVGRHGIGTYCYGTGAFCNDPVDSSNGTHAYPYVYQVWAYDAAQLAQVKAGLKQPWDVIPYAVWNFTLPYQDPAATIGGVTYDAATQRLFIAQARAGTSGQVAIYAFKVNVPAPPVIEADFTINTKDGRTVTISRQPMSPASNAVLVVDPSMIVCVNGACW